MLELASCVLDVTPPDGNAIGFVMPEKPAPARDPLFARLYLLDDGDSRILISTLMGWNCSPHLRK